ncbi:MAG: hypothetical protein GY847_28915 [Proteobacteria bacterium]|nr:hypothetical protein [Pseudomonadota bacterium]
MYNTVFKKNIDTLQTVFPNEGVVGGDRITEKFEAARSTNAAAYTKADVNPAPASNTLIKPYWDKVQYATACEIEGIDISNARNGGTELDLVSHEIMTETRELWDTIFSAMMTQIAADVDDASAYSDKGLSRSTYPTLASYNEDTDATITLAYQRGLQYNTMLNKNCGPISGYVGLMEHSVYNTLKPLAAALSTWSDSPVKNDTKMGWPEMSNFEGLDIIHPSEIPGMTTGICYMLRREDVHITVHRPLEIEQVPSGRDSSMFVIRTGINVNVVNPGFQGKMEDKD